MTTFCSFLRNLSGTHFLSDEVHPFERIVQTLNSKLMTWCQSVTLFSLIKLFESFLKISNVFELFHLAVKSQDVLKYGKVIKLSGFCLWLESNYLQNLFSFLVSWWWDSQEWNNYQIKQREIIINPKAATKNFFQFCCLHTFRLCVLLETIGMGTHTFCLIIISYELSLFFKVQAQ